jgi:hypothetical protein
MGSGEARKTGTFFMRRFTVHNTKPAAIITQ